MGLALVNGLKIRRTIRMQYKPDATYCGSKEILDFPLVFAMLAPNL